MFIRAEHKNVAGAHFSFNFDIRTIPASHDYPSVHNVFHVRGAWGFGAWGWDMLGKVCGSDEELTGWDVEVGQEKYFHVVVHGRVVVDQSLQGVKGFYHFLAFEVRVRGAAWNEVEHFTCGFLTMSTTLFNLKVTEKDVEQVQHLTLCRWDSLSHYINHQGLSTAISWQVSLKERSQGTAVLCGFS